MTQIPFIKNNFILKNGYIPYVYGTKCDKFYTLNNDAKDILSKFNGKDSIEEISQQLAIERNENAEDINSIIESLIASTNFLSSSKNIIYDDDQHCGVGITSVAVDNSGNLKLCVMCPTIKWGNVFNEDLRNIFSNERTKYFADLIVPKIDICGDCEYLWFCNNCSARGITKYMEIGDECVWGKERIGEL